MGYRPATDNCYNEWWLRVDMENMAYLFEYCDKYCKQLFNIEIDKLKFLNAFMVSTFRYTMETGHERLLSQSAIDSVKMFGNVDCDGDLRPFKKDKNTSNNYAYHQMYWVGWMYAYLHFKEDILSADLVKILPIETMLEHYYLGHEMDKEVYYKHIKDIFNKKG